MHCFLHKQFICQECGLGLDASVSRPSRDAVVPRLGLASELVRLGLVSVSSSEGLGLGLALVSSKKASCTSLQIMREYTGSHSAGDNFFLIFSQLFPHYVWLIQQYTIDYIFISLSYIMLH